MNFTWKISGEKGKEKESDKASHYSQSQCNIEIQQFCTSCHLYHLLYARNILFVHLCIFFCVSFFAEELSQTSYNWLKEIYQDSWSCLETKSVTHQTQNMTTENLFFDTVLQRCKVRLSFKLAFPDNGSNLVTSLQSLSVARF